MEILIIIAAALVAAALIFFYLIFPSPRRHSDLEGMKGMYIAHRGLHSLSENTPENSMASFRAAILAGYAIETDLHLSSDGEVVIFHDDSMKRMCGVDRRPEDMTLEEIRALRLAGTDEGVPTLKEFLELVDGKVPLLIEIKCKKRSCRRLCSAANVILSGYSGKYYIQSFYPPALLWYRRHRPDVCRGQLSTGKFGYRGIEFRMLSLLLLNFISRPDFISYDCRFAHKWVLRLCVRLGALKVGWGYASQASLDKYGKDFSTHIFEKFIPE